MSFLDTLMGMFSGKHDVAEAANVEELKQKITEQAAGGLGQVPEPTLPDMADAVPPMPTPQTPPMTPPVSPDMTASVVQPVQSVVPPVAPPVAQQVPPIAPPQAPLSAEVTSPLSGNATPDIQTPPSTTIGR